jgi:hypothetical protein
MHCPPRVPVSRERSERFSHPTWIDTLTSVRGYPAVRFPRCLSFILTSFNLIEKHIPPYIAAALRDLHTFAQRGERVV